MASGQPDRDVGRFIYLLGQATCELDRPYYELPIAGQALPEYRERVYAYELYHQLRCIWPAPPEWTFFLNGEVDKRGHPLPQLQGVFVKDRIPDLLVHRPGDEHGNLVIIEIKSVAAGPDDVANDLCKLTAFCRQVGYRQGVLLFFGSGSSVERLRALCLDGLERAQGEADGAQVLVYWHAGPRVAPISIPLERPEPQDVPGPIGERTPP